MTVLIGHPTGSPNSHYAALAHFEAGWLEAFCVPWMPRQLELTLLSRIPGLGGSAKRLRRRRFVPLDRARKVQGRAGEWGRMARRLIGGSWADERISYEANDWLMRTMARECRRKTVTALHAYEDCALWQFEEAARLGKRCVYELPGGYYPAWVEVYQTLATRYSDWLPQGVRWESAYVRPEQKRQELALADLTLAPSSFVQRTVQRLADRKVAITAYGVDSNFWSPGEPPGAAGDVNRPLRFLYVGQCSIRKGIPLLIEAWRAAALEDATLELVGGWHLAASKRANLPRGVTWSAPLLPEELRDRYRAADMFIFPSNFDGFGLVMLEAMACGLPVIATDASAGPDILDDNTGSVFPADNLDALIESLKQASGARDRLATMRGAARRKAESMTWSRYQDRVRTAVAPFVAGS